MYLEGTEWDYALSPRSVQMERTHTNKTRVGKGTTDPEGMVTVPPTDHNQSRSDRAPAAQAALRVSDIQLSEATRWLRLNSQQMQLNWAKSKPLGPEKRKC